MHGKFFVCVCISMAALYLSCSETASPGSREIFLATDPGETVEPAPVVDLRQVAEAASADLQASVPDGEELVYSRVTAAAADDDHDAVTVETGGLDDAIHQRAARPWTHLDATEPYVYRSAAGQEKREDGTLVRTSRVYRRPNLSPRREVPVFEPPFVDEKLRRELAAHDDPEALVRVHLKARHAPRYDKPLRPRGGASPAEVLQVESAREQWETDRQARIRAFLEPVLQELETLDGTGMQVLGTNGWVGVSLPPSSVELLFEDERFAAVVSAQKSYRDNSCNPSCNDRSQSAANMSNEWYLGDGHELARLGSLKFLQQGYDGSYSGSLRHDYGSLVAGIGEIGAYEDDGLFDNVNYSTWRIFKKYRCDRACVGIPCGDDCCIGIWDHECNQQSNFQDAEGANCGDLLNDEGHPYGCHGTPVSSILLSNYKVSSVESGSYGLGDPCFNSAGDNSHCDSFYAKTRGMAPGAKGIFYWLDNSEFLGYRFAKYDSVDVLNLSHGADEDRCVLFSESIEFDELEDAFDDGVFVVNSTGNFKYSDYMDGFRRNLTQNDCLLNEASIKPKVFSVGGIYNRVYNYSSYGLLYPNPPGGIFMDAWSLTNTSSTYQSSASLHPIDADDYRNQRLDPLGSQTGGRDLTIKNESGVSVNYSRAMTGVDLLAPRGGWRATSADGVMGETDDFFSGSSGAAPHLSGLSLLVKHWLLAVFPSGWSWNINDPGNLHVVMLLMGDRSAFNESTLKMYNKLTGGDMMYGFGRVRLRLLGDSESELSTMEFFDHTYANNDDFPSVGYMGRRLFATPAPATTTFVKVVMMQVEDMDGKSSNDVVSDFQLDLYVTNGTYATACPESFVTACGNPAANGDTPNCARRSDASRDVKKMIAYEALTGSHFQGKCFYKRIKKRRITPQGVTLKFAYYRSQVPDWASSSGHTCAVKTEGLFNKYAYCWGNNDQGQLGDGTTNYRFSPVQIATTQIPNLITAGGGHTCMTRFLDGLAYCWGRNDHGQLGTNSLVNVKTPTATGLTSVQVISAGALHTCAVKTDNSLWCWGSNRYGQLGTGDVSDKLVPTQIAVGTSFSSVSAGKHHTCARRTNSSIFCWGLNDRGQSGSASGAVVLTPHQVGVNFNQVSSGGVHSCGVTINNVAFCWGDNRFGQYGDGSVNDGSHIPTLVPSFLDVSTIHAGGTHTCARKTNGTVWCWGDNRFGQLGIGNVTNHYSPQQLTALGAVNSLSVGKNHHSCALKTDGTVSCWGQNDNAQLGRNYISRYSNYVSTITSLQNVIGISTGN